ncbi:OmpA family protein [Vibrio cincinnatiensis]|uniref:OmpA family protein n=1 Tax=Vibrio cincinnatiensis TaxID=675 RepID=UPI001EDD1052|nr:OmpA family protein [Vibrio cincinnatiensis]MCG3722544.1 OmpA family protein [Vibrio cincinnatiensis]
MTIHFRLITLLLAAGSFGVMAEPVMPRQTALHYYCNSPDLEFEQRVQVAEGRRVHLNQGAFTQIEDQERYPASLAFVEQQMIRAGIQGACAEYLLSHAKLSVEQSDLLARVYFSFDSAELSDSSRYLLTQIVERLQQDQQLKVEGHTDNIGSDEYNFSLGLRRAQSVTAYLQQQASHSISAEVISYGERKPLMSNETVQGRAQNRRVDIY